VRYCIYDPVKLKFLASHEKNRMGGYSTSSGHVGKCMFGCRTHRGPLNSSVFHPLFLDLSLLCYVLKKGVIQSFPLGML
jgi:hypothetical protein